jgi:hypothetical protein
MPTLPQADKPSIQELWILWRYRKREHVSTTRSLQFAVILLLVEPHNYQVSLWTTRDVCQCGQFPDIAPAAFAGACHFEYDPISLPTYYRTEGWVLPGITDFNPSATPRLAELPSIKPVPGAISELLSHDEYPYIIEFPAQQFVLNGARQKMRSTQVKVGMVRWKVDGHIIAYSYGLIPVTARRVNGKWDVQSELGCIFTATFIDDRGDGVFRILVPWQFDDKPHSRVGETQGKLTWR